MEKFRKSKEYIKSGFRDAWEGYKQVYKDARDSIVHTFNTFKTAKRNGRSYSSQEYRGRLAHDLKNLRKNWDRWKELAKALLEEEKLAVWPKWDSLYLESLWKSRKVWNDVANKLIENGNGYTVVKYIDKFEWLDKETAKKLIEVKWTHDNVTIDVGVESVALNLDKFEWLDEEVAELIIEKWFGKDVAANLEKFEWLNHKKIAGKLIEKWNWWAVVYYIDKFNWLDKETARSLIDAWYWSFVAENPDEFWLKKEK